MRLQVDEKTLAQDALAVANSSSATPADEIETPTKPSKPSVAVANSSSATPADEIETPTKPSKPSKRISGKRSLMHPPAKPAHLEKLKRDVSSAFGEVVNNVVPLYTSHASVTKDGQRCEVVGFCYVGEKRVRVWIHTFRFFSDVLFSFV